MKYILLIVVGIFVAYVTYEYVRISRLVRIGERLGAEAQPFQKAEGSRAVLVVGDSTAVGVGASAELSIAGRISQLLDASVENYAVSGAKTGDVLQQLSRAQKERYDLVLVQVGANDIIRFSSLDTLRGELPLVLAEARKVSDSVVLLTAGKVGEAPFFPRALSWLWTARAGTVREHFMAAAQKHDVVYVDLFSASDPFASDTERYYARDGLHLSKDGYGFWYEEVKKALDAAGKGAHMYGQ